MYINKALSVGAEATARLKRVMCCLASRASIGAPGLCHILSELEMAKIISASARSVLLVEPMGVLA